MKDEAQPTKGALPRDEFGRGESWHWIVLVVPAIVAGLAFLLHSIRPATVGAPTIVVYCAQDMVYAEPILKEFERRNNCRIRTVFDSEAVKTVGLANRLIAERSRPRADLFWGNEEMRTRQMAEAGVFRPENGWAAFGYRSRRIAVNTNLLSAAEAPKSLLELTNVVWRGKVILAYPQFGTTATHFHALRQHWGDQAWESWCRALAANKPFLAEGNSTVVKLLGARVAPIGLTDSDDIDVGLAKGWPLAEQPVNEETLLVPNTVGVINKSEVSPLSQALFEYLQSAEVIEKLVDAGALEGGDPARLLQDERLTARPLQVDWDALLRDLDDTTRRLNAIFLR
jgi:iron(III) transport system substrate-binding protein